MGSLLAILSCAHAAALKPPLLRALSASKPLIVELQVEEPDTSAVGFLDAAELSSRLRTAGAAAVIAPPMLVEAIISEQETARGGFPGPLPVLWDASDSSDESSWEVAAVAAAQGSGAAGVAVRCADAESASSLAVLVDAAGAAQLECLVLAGVPEVLDAAQAAGATAVACDYAMEESGAPLSADDSAATVILGAWGGEDEELAQLRDAGWSAMLLLDGVGGEVAAGADYCEGRVRAFRSKASKAWGGSMFASTSGDASTPSGRNPRLWAQSQRQARELMHESAKSRGLSAPKLKKNPVL